MRRIGLALAVLALASCGTSGGDGEEGDGGHKRDSGLKRDGGDIDLVPADAGWVDPCPAEAKLVYVVDSDNRFSSFAPKALTTGGQAFTDLGTLNCPAGNATPFSMSVDRQAVAWVLYNDGRLFKVNTTTLACTATSYSPRSSLKFFGMGFVSNSAGSQDETLFVAGGASTGLSSSTLAKMQNLVLTDVGTVSGNPELTGTGDGKLWGFFPDQTSPRIAEIAKTSGALGTTFPLSGIAGEPSAWAFAFWGGDFYVFLERQTDSSTAVHRVDGTDGTLTTPLSNTGRHIVGAGVSTCAPVGPN